jgi:hypothetical protein
VLRRNAQALGCAVGGGRAPVSILLFETKRQARPFTMRKKKKEEAMNTMPVRLLIATGAAAGLLVLSGTSASATIACQGDFCWRVHSRYPYPRSPTIVIHPDYWRPPTATIVIHERWRPVERFTREYIVRDYGGFDDPEW